MAGAAVDGRTARRVQNADVVVDAVLELLAEGHLRPSGAQIAERSGISPRSVFRYFDDLEQLTMVAVERQTSRKDHLFRRLEPGGTKRERIERLVDHRLALWDDVGPIIRAARLREPFQPSIAAALDRRRRQLRAQLVALFPDCGPDTVTALEIATGFEALEGLRHDRRLSSRKAAAVLRIAVAAIVAY